jgi:hypothetical protein
MQDLKFCDTSYRLPPWCSSGLRSSGTLRGVHLQLIADVSWQPIGTLCNGQAVLDTLESKNVAIYLRRPTISFRSLSKLTFKIDVHVYKPNVLCQ